MGKFQNVCKNGHDMSKTRRILNGKSRCYTCESENHRKRLLKKKYGITPTDVQAMLEQQDYACAVCKSPDWRRPRPCVDHDHTTGQVRGLLCSRCNLVLGLVEDDEELLTNMIQYLWRN